ncbi:hypothetical protein AC579_2721 [Pseudocercospora musae]|uniref:DUF7580 domain-containing protein n=1 Tax=Pseudocercospora musae TaxID=113226 RepID=A0A139IV95_9PEZI|nr:hypothetical protein AC579_2721 [Pseudocercospora musae]
MGKIFKGFKLALKKELYMDLLDNIRYDNAHLERLMGHMAALQPWRKARNTPYFESFRPAAIGIYQTLSQGLRASCMAPHHASICLNASPGGPLSTNEAPAERFGVFLHHDTGPKHRALSWSLEEAEIRLNHAVSALDQMSSGAVQKPEPTDLSPPTRKKSTVGFQGPREQANDHFKAHNPARAPQDTPQDSPKSLEIHDLCETMKTLRSAQHDLYWPEKRLFNEKAISGDSLASILAQTSASRTELSNGDAHRLAYSLAMGVLQFRDTPWLDSSWSTVTVTLVVLSEYPFVSKQLVTGSYPAGASSSLTRKVKAVIRNQMLLRLGITLIELCLQKPIRELRRAEDLEDGDDLADFYTADRLLQTGKIADRLGFK